MTRWTEDMHDAWKRRQAARYASEDVPAPSSTERKPGPLPGRRGPYLLPLPPTVNHSSAPAAGGGRYLTAEHREFRRLVAQVVGQVEPLEGRLSVRIALIQTDRRRWDIDNRIKAALDAAQHAGVFLRDDQIDRLYVERLVDQDAERPICIVEVGEIHA